MMTPQSSSVLGEETTQVLDFTSLLDNPEGKEEPNASNPYKYGIPPLRPVMLPILTMLALISPSFFILADGRNCCNAALTADSQSAAEVALLCTAEACALAIFSLIICTVCSAQLNVLSKYNTLHLSAASNMEIARPFPIPEPAQPAPVAMATSPFNDRDSGSGRINSDMMALSKRQLVFI
ncbi:unnamed protein product [Clonostachys rhizophaga]|uniref:Uncharacterized protein n=1 Tax=Clonostachys rhizophaga TaxID=160324 RepID=A0A9N9V5F7_9HYPO|nr:unnamed protein product [Clonostachys rhizophaga]